MARRALLLGAVAVLGAAACEPMAPPPPPPPPPGPGAQCNGTVLAAGDSTQTVTVNGMTRSYIRRIPTGYTGRTQVPVVMDFHPLGGTGARQQSLSNFGAVANARGFIAVWPNGVGNSWNVGRCCGTAQQQRIDDVAFARAIVRDLQADAACIDTRRVYATGCSNGGGMAYKVACDAADTFAGVAPVDFDCITNPTNNPSCGMCTPSRPITEVQFRGTRDTAVPFNGGNTPVVAGLAFPGAVQNFMIWGMINRCTGTPQSVAGRPGCMRFPMCAGGVDTVLCTVQNGTHCGSYASFDIANKAFEMLERQVLP
jgi:polyhydroxybutyrate depolymerase